jgi:hypothetical protein
VAKVFLVGHIPPEHVPGFLATIRKWERQHADTVEMAIRVDDSHDEIEGAEELMHSLFPDMNFYKIPRR